MTLRAHARLIGRAMWRGADKLMNGEGFTHAAAIAYYALLSLFPFLLLMLSVLGRFTADAIDRDRVVAFVFDYFPGQFEFITGQLDAFRASTLSIGIGGIVGLIWASLGVFNAITAAVNHAWAVERHRNFFKHRLVGFLMLVSAGAFLAVALAIVSAAKVAQTRWFGALGPPSPMMQWLSGLAANQLATLLLIGCVAMIFYFIPNAPVRFRDVWPGAIVVGLLWRAALAGFSWYARDLAAWTVIHGPVTTVVVFLFWIYTCSVILLFGVTMTAAYARLQDATLRHPGMTHAEG